MKIKCGSEVFSERNRGERGSFALLVDESSPRALQGERREGVRGRELGRWAVRRDLNSRVTGEM